MSTITHHERDKILYLSLSNPEFCNSFGPKEAILLKKVLEGAVKQVVGLVFQSALERFFCTGGNLKFYAGLKNKNEGIEANRSIRESLEMLAQWPHPTAAAVNGDCFGGGIEVLSCFDYVVSSPKSVFGLWQRKIGLSYGWGGGARLLKRLSHHELKKAALEAGLLSAYEARQVGLIDCVCMDNQIVERATRWVKKSSKGNRTTFGVLKNFSAENEVEAFERLWLNAEHEKNLSKYGKP